jgi:hypothetical protein
MHPAASGTTCAAQRHCPAPCGIVPSHDLGISRSQVAGRRSQVVGKARSGRGHQKGTDACGTYPHGATQTSTTTSTNGSAGYRSSGSVRLDREVLAPGAASRPRESDSGAGASWR